MIAVLEIVGMFLCLLVPTLIYRQWWLAGMFLLVGVCFIAAELLCIHYTGVTISQHFWSLAKEHKGKAITIVCFMAAAMTLLILHFIAR